MRKSILGVDVSPDCESADADNGIRDVMMSVDEPEQEQSIRTVIRTGEQGLR
ncbi:hypothetical protein ACQP0C_23275 [Nocardia sp. CA-129566]|uniref:hypothetical protein n=1 Tax=Nocardia sp. CA-129566 TaxID=3239976 RepID=UPI003D99EC21